MRTLIFIESILHNNGTDEYGRYATMALRLQPEGVDELGMYATWLQCKQKDVHPADRDYSYIDYHCKAAENETDPEKLKGLIRSLRGSEASRDFYTGSFKQINCLIQFDPEPNRAITETTVELYKVSISLRSGGEKY